MSYRTVLVHCNDRRRIKRLVEAAGEVASRFNAHLIGLSISPPVFVFPGGMPGTPDTIVIDERRQAYHKDNPDLRSAFLEAAAHRQTVVSEWRELEADRASVSEVALEHARSADLVIVSQADPAWSGSAYLDATEVLVMGSGRPTLVVPNEGLSSGIGSRVLVAWNDTREAARAVFDALPLIKAASAVKVVRIEAQEAADEIGQAAADICETLQRHGVKCPATEKVSVGGDVGQALTQQALSHRADLMVMGCYGHWRLRELLFGGASRYQLRHMTIPVLMSH